MRKIVLSILLLLVSASAEAEPSSIKGYDFNPEPTIKRYNHILMMIGATQRERLMLLTLGIIEGGGSGDYYGICDKWGCDKGTSHTIWQIQCLEKDGTSWKDNRWLYYLRIKMKHPTLRCNDLNEDEGLGAAAALEILREFGKYTSGRDHIHHMMLWGASPNPDRRRALLSYHYNKVKTFLGE